MGSTQKGSLVNEEAKDAQLPLTAADEARLAATIDNWKRRLLDVSKRNRALNFRPNKVTSITVIDEQPAEVFRQLSLQGQQMRFRPASQEKTAPLFSADATAQEQAEEGVDEFAPALDFVPYDATSLTDQYTDDVLQTSSSPEKLDQSLRRIDEQARASLEEQGVNTLFLALGMLHYKESSVSEEVFRAPLILLPVELNRRSARAGYTVKATDDEPIVNPALAEYLRRGFGITLPDLPDLTNLPEDYDLQQFFIEATAAVASQNTWQIKRDIYLAFFSFQKFIMYKDMEANATAFSSHPLIRQIILRSGTSIRALPEDIRAAQLDQEFAPERTAQVTNADSSQLRAILAVSRDHNLVIEGPPGTGKSQTITNLVAQALAQNKSVLFVAEKMAALEVVYNRLVEAGLGEFCLELHSTKANKRTVMKDIAAALDASLQRPQAVETATGRIGTVRTQLTAYATAAHTPFGALSLSPYQGFGELERVRSAPKLKFTQSAEAVTRAQLNDTERALRDLAQAAQAIGVPVEHPWRDTTRTLYSEDDLDRAQEILNSLRAHLAKIRELAEQAQREFSLPAIENHSDVHTAAAVAQVIARSPGAPLPVLQSEAWNSPPRQAVELLERGRSVKELREHIESRFAAEVLQQEHVDDIAYIEAKESTIFRIFNFLSGRFRATKRRWRSYCLPSYKATLLEQAAEMRKVDALQRERTNLASQDAQAQQLFGALWQGEASDWNALSGYIAWVTEFRRICIANGLKEQTLAIATHPHPDVSIIKSLESEGEQLKRDLAALRAHIGWPQNYLASSSFAELAERLDALYDNLHLAARWSAFEYVRFKASSGLASELLEPAMQGEVPFPDLPSAFRRAFFQRWLNEVIQQREPLRGFSTLTHEQRVAEFRQLDEQVLAENRLNVVRYLRNRVQEQLRTKEAVDVMPFLRRQLTLQRGLSPLRTTFQRSLPAIRVIKPVFMMSPLSVSQLLDGKQLPFDLVIFDEASQLPAEDAAGAIGRGRQLVVVGDPKQLPPTNFFSVITGTVTAPLGEDGTPLFDNTESILEEFMGSGAPMARLKWHYRSAHESLINFSNVSFYDCDLYTFPSVETDSQAVGLSFEYVADGVYEGKGLNLIEARRVADAVVRHAKEHPKVSLGVGTFNLRQQMAVLDELEVRRRQDPSLEPFFARDKKEPFFVKNLENIQGDERDVIFLSVTYAKDANDVMRYNFGPLNGENGWRRLNVLTTRARKSMRVFSSIKGDNINPVHASSPGPQLLKDFLTYAQYGRLNRTITSTAAETESPFEREVYMELTRRGLKLQPQVGVAGYRIDLAVIDEALPGRYLCGLECDGMAYHSSETARDRDRLRQQVLEARGWTIHRIWSTDWFKDRQGQIERLLRLIEQTRTAAQVEKAAEAEAQARLASLEQEGKQNPAESELDTVAASKTTAATKAAPYVFAKTSPQHPGQDLNAAPSSQVSRTIAEVVAIEAPLHVKDLASRVAAHWGNNIVGPSMLRRIRSVLTDLAHSEAVILRGDFVFGSGSVDNISVRSRAGTNIPADRIAPEEYRAAILMVLQAGDGVDRKTLTNTVRALFGFNRTGQTLETAIGAAIESLLAEQIVGEGSTGIRLRV
jgi:very-short-patch-repair endonuclease